jgi:hypothetical protein
LPDRRTAPQAFWRSGPAHAPLAPVAIVFFDSTHDFGGLLESAPLRTPQTRDFRLCEGHERAQVLQFVLISFDLP